MAEQQTIEQRLEAAKARRAAVADAREKKNAAALLEAEVAAEEQAAVDDEALVKLEDEHGPEGQSFKVIRSDLGAVAVRRAPAAAFKKFQDLSSRPNAKMHELSDELMRHCLLYPSKERFEEMLRAQPHTLIRCANKVAELAGVRAEEVAGKS